MKNCFYLIMSAFVLSASVFTSFAFAENVEKNQGVYAQLSSMEDQFPKGTQLITLEKIDKLEGIEQQQARVIIKEPGTYFVMAAGQAGTDKKEPIAQGFVDFWLIKNGQDIPNSGVRQYLETIDSTSVIVSQNILVLKKGDILSFGYSSSKPSLGFISIASNNTQPSIPSMIVSIYKIGS